MKLSLVVNVKDMAETLPKTLQSAKGIVDEMVVVDMQSSDETVARAKEFGARIYTYPHDLGFADPARNFALDKAKGEWILVLDADEELSPGLAKLVQQIVNGQVDQNLQADCYFIPRQNVIFGKIIEHTAWWPDRQLRLFKNGKVHWTDNVHTHPESEGTVLELPADPEIAIIHHNYQTVSQFLLRLDRYTSLQAQREKGVDPLAVRSFTTTQAISAFSNEFFQRFFVNEGVNDNLHGLSLSFLQATYELAVFLKQWQDAGFLPTKNDQPETIQALEKFEREMRYWLADWHVKNSSGLVKLIWKIRRKLQK